MDAGKWKMRKQSLEVIDLIQEPRIKTTDLKEPVSRGLLVS